MEAGGEACTHGEPEVANTGAKCGGAKVGCRESWVTTLVVPSPATEGGSMDVECHLFGREGAKAGVQG